MGIMTNNELTKQLEQYGLCYIRSNTKIKIYNKCGQVVHESLKQVSEIEEIDVKLFGEWYRKNWKNQGLI